MLLQQISTGSGAEASSESLRNLAVGEFQANFPLASFAQFYSHTGNADTPRQADNDMNVGSNRSISTAYTAKEQTPGFGATALKIYGDLVQTDIAHERRGTDIGSQRTKDLVKFSQSLGRYFMDSVINDTLSSTKFRGLKSWCDSLSRKVVFESENGGAVPAGNAAADVKQQAKFREYFNKQILDIQGGAQLILANPDFISRMESIGLQYVSTTTVQDIYGQNQTFTTYRGIPVINAGYKADNSGWVIPSNETEGTSSDCTSVYIVRFGEETDATFATNIGMDVRNLGQVGTKLQTLVEFDIDFVVLNSKAIKRIGGIRLDA